MKKLMFLSLMITFFVLVGKAQTVSKDSISVLKNQKQIAELTAKLNDEKLKLAAMENSLPNKKEAEDKAKERAQKSADENANIASGLTDNADSKKLARKAKKAAKQVKRDAKKLRKASSGLESHQKGIDSLREKIASHESDLDKMQKEL